MKTRFTKEQREKMSQEMKGKVIESLLFSQDLIADDEPYYTITFTDGSEMSFHFMADLLGPYSRVRA